MDYPKDELGEQESVVIKGTGYIMVDGTWYLATMEEGLRTCTKDHIKRDPSDKLWIDEAEMLDRVAARRAYQLHRHGRRDADGYQRYLLPNVKDYIAYDVISGEVLSHAKPTNKTVTIPMSLGAKAGQKYPYKSPEWQRAYNLRSTVERKNRELKHNNFLDLESADRRPQRGYAANAVAIAMLVTAGNLLTLDNFLRTGEGIDTTKSPRRRKTKRVEKGIAGVTKQRDGRTTRKSLPKAA
jgi:hypothetical protein